MITVDLILNIYTVHLLFEQIQYLKPLGDLFEESKQLLESKQTADLMRNSKFYSKHLCFEQIQC